LPGRSSGYPDPPKQAFFGRNCEKHIGKPKLSDAIMWRARLDHGENDESGKALTKRDE
jgi:hypothetical protein